MKEPKDQSQRTAYGKNRKQKDFAGVKYDRLVLEVVPKGKTEQPVLSKAINDYLYRGHGDTMIVVDPKDIPHKGPFREAIEAKGATIEVVLKKTTKPGPKSKLDGISDEASAAIKAIWDIPYYEAEAAKMISEELGFKVDRFWCRRNLGERGYKKNK